MTSQSNNTSNDASNVDVENGFNKNINQKQNYQNQDIHNKVKFLTFMNVINFLALIAIATSFGIITSKNTNTTRDAIAAFQGTGDSFRVDPKNGVLTNANNGNSVITVAEGHTVSAVIAKDENTGDEVSCISMDDLAQMVVNSEKGIRNIVSVHDKDGNVNSVLAMDGNTVVTDDYVTLASGKWMVYFDSPACQGANEDDVDVEIHDRDRHLVGRGLLDSHVASIKSGESRQLLRISNGILKSLL